MTQGDNYNIPCPSCGTINHYIVDTAFEKNETIHLVKECPSCKALIHYTAFYEIKLLAEIVK